MVSAVDPCLQVGEDKMDHRQVLLCLLRIAPERESVMSIPNLTKAAIPLPAVSADGGACRYAILDEGRKRISIAAGKRIIRLFDAGDNAESETASISEFLDRNAAFMSILPFRATILGILARPNFNSTNYCRLMMNSLSFAPRAATNAALVNFDWMMGADGVTIWAYHPRAKFVKHSERRLIPSNPKLALKLDGGLAWCLRSHEVRPPKPSRERHMARLHDRSSGERRVSLTSAATQHNRRAGIKPVWFADDATLEARKTIRPANCLQITGTGSIIREDALELWKASWEGRIHALRGYHQPPRLSSIRISMQ
jgi:hypothetical protein